MSADGRLQRLIGRHSHKFDGPDVPADWHWAGLPSWMTGYATVLRSCEVKRLKGFPAALLAAPWSVDDAADGSKSDDGHASARRPDDGDRASDGASVSRASLGSDDEDFPAARAHQWVCLSLDAGINQLRKLSGLAAIAPNLLRLDVSVNHIRSLRKLPELPSLRELNISNNMLTSLQGLPAMPALLRLDASMNDLDSVAGLPPLPCLRWLSLADNHLEVLTLLPELPAVTHVQLQRNDLTIVSALAELASVQEVQLAYNRLATLSDLVSLVHAMPSLRRVVAEGNPLADEPSYRFVMLECESLQSLDYRPLHKADRAELQRLRRVTELDEVVKETSSTYLARIELERGKMAAQMEEARARERRAMASFDAYRQQMQSELEECIRHVQALSDGSAIDTTWLASEEGLAAWRARLAAERAAIAKEGREAAHRDEALLDSEADMLASDIGYADKLRELQYRRPDIWAMLKEREAALRSAETRAAVAAAGAVRREDALDAAARTAALRGREKELLAAAEEVTVPVEAWWPTLALSEERAARMVQRQWREKKGAAAAGGGSGSSRHGRAASGRTPSPASSDVDGGEIAAGLMSAPTVVQRRRPSALRAAAASIAGSSTAV
eukprot:PLAT4846.1.p1 GENE.PLAT4846.1~~PLAT4846.1.p1  ORF type:complete len:616 (-),score=292.27 PLAT4846.1:186-2033(-)